jgi:hypothetical protein
VKRVDSGDAGGCSWRRARDLRLLALLQAFLLALPTPLGADGFALQGLLAARIARTRSQDTWLKSGFGRLSDGVGRAPNTAFTLRGQLHFGFLWEPSPAWRIRAHAVLQGEPPSYGGRRGGPVEAFVQFKPELTPRTALRFRAGSFFPQTSLENSEPLWQSPYTLTLSALNTWTAEELRLTGIEAALLLGDSGVSQLEMAGVVFGLNDSLGALIGWRGWTLGDRLTTLGESLPLPRLSSFRTGDAFAEQRGGTRPVDELDGRLGWQARGRWSRAGGTDVRVAYLDNRGDRALHRGQYAWQTSFLTAGAQVPLGAWRLLAESALGDTGMGPALPEGPRVEVRFRAGYVLMSWESGSWRASVRLDGFRNEDRDGTAEPNQESGWAWAVAVFWEPLAAVRLGAEYLDVRSQRPAAAFSGADPNTDARRALLDLRVRF